jgi:hypothetical protein
MYQIQPSLSFTQQGGSLFLGHPVMKGPDQLLSEGRTAPSSLYNLYMAAAPQVGPWTENQTSAVQCIRSIPPSSLPLKELPHVKASALLAQWLAEPLLLSSCAVAGPTASATALPWLSKAQLLQRHVWIYCHILRLPAQPLVQHSACITPGWAGHASILERGPTLTAQRLHQVPHA